MAYIFDAAKGETPGSVSEKRKLADSLAARIFGRTPKNVGEGLNTLGQAWIARTMLDEANAAQKSGEASRTGALSEIFGPMITGGMGGGPAPMSGGSSAPAEAMAPTPMVPSTAGKIYEADEPSPLDPPSGGDREAMIRTILGEAGNQPAVGQNAVASVIRNRAVAGNFGGDTPTGVVTARNQFEPWNTPGGRSGMEAAAANPAKRAQAEAAIADAYGEGGRAPADPTMGATHFFAPKAQAALGRPAPAWGRGPGQDIADHRFFGGAGQPQVTAGQQVAAVDDAALPPNATPTQSQPMRQQGPSIEQLMRAANNPWLQPGDQARINMLLKQRIEEEQQARDPLRRLQIQKAERDLADGKNPESVREYEYAKGQGFTGSFSDWIASKRAGAGEYGLTPIWGTGPDGKPAYIQPGKSGDARLAKLPDGFQIARDPIRVDAGDHYVLLDPQTRQPVGQVKKNLAEASAQREIGTEQGKARVNLPATLFKAEQSLSVIDQMINHPGRETATGLSGTLDPRNYFGGTDAKNFQVMAKQLEGKAFLEAFESLKGGGQITEIEGAKATQAMARLDRAQSDAEYVAALKELRGVIAAGIERAKQKAGVATGTASAGPAASAGPSIDDLVKQYGGN